MGKYFMSAIMLLLGCGQSYEIPEGCEITITCRGYIKESLYVQVVSGKHEETFGAIGPGPKGRDGGKTIGFGPIQIGNQVKIKWGVEGQDELRMEHECILDTSGYLPVKKQIKAVEFIYEGKGKWIFKAFDDSPYHPGTKEILPVTSSSNTSVPLSASGNVSDNGQAKPNSGAGR